MALFYREYPTAGQTVPSCFTVFLSYVPARFLYSVVLLHKLPLSRLLDVSQSEESRLLAKEVLKKTGLSRTSRVTAADLLWRHLFPNKTGQLKSAVKTSEEAAPPSNRWVDATKSATVPNLILGPAS